MSASTRAARCAALIWVAVFVCLVLALALSFTPEDPHGLSGDAAR